MENNTNNIILFKKNEKTLLSIANEKLNSGDTEGALSLYLEIEKNQKFSVTLYRDIANAYTNLQMYSESIIYWFKYLNSVSKRHYAQAYNGLGGNYYLAGLEDLSAYYFNLQINSEDDSEYPFDDYLYDLFSSISDQPESDIKLVDLQGEEDEKNINKAKKIFEKEPEKAYLLVEEIQEDSSQYENACITLAAFYMVDGEYKKASSYYKKINKNSENYAYALNNLFGAQFCNNDIEQAEKTFQILKKEDLLELDQLIKFFYIIRSSGDNNLNYLYAKYLRSFFTTPKLYYCSAVAAYNVGEYQEAKECFFDYFKVTNSYPALYGIEASESRIKGKSGYPERLTFSAVLCESKVIQLEKLATKYLSLSSRQLKRISQEILEYATAVFSGSHIELQIIACQLLSILGDKKSEKYLKNLLINPNLTDNIKIIILTVLVEMGNDKLTGMVYGNVYSRIQFEKIEFLEDNSEVFLSAYAIAFGRLAPYDEHELYKLKISAYEIYYKLLGNGNLRKITDIMPLAAYIAVNAGIKIKLMPEELIVYIGSTVEEVNNIIKLTQKD